MIEKTYTTSDVESARKIIPRLNVLKGDRVLVTRDQYSEPIVSELVCKVCREAGAIVLEMTLPNRLIGAKGIDIPRAWEILTRGVEGVDLWISLTAGSAGATIWKSQLENGVVTAMLQIWRLEDFRTDLWNYPVELQNEIFERLIKEIEGKHELRITSPAGTDYTAIIPKGKLFTQGDGGQHTLLRPGNWYGGPGGCLSFFPVTQNGIHVAQYFAAGCGLPGVTENPFLDPKNPMVLTIKDNWIVDVKGDFADVMLKLWETKGNEASRFVAGPMVGIAPKAYPFGWPNKVENIQWYFPFHYSPWLSWLLVGNTRQMSFFRGPSAPHGLRPYTYKPTWTVDGKVILQNGRFSFMDDPEMRSFASRFGDPDELLKTTPFPPEIFDEGPGGKAVIDKVNKARGKAQ
jgi:hypothetical protein